MKNLNYIVERVRLAMNIGTTQYDQQFLQWAIDGYRKLNELELIQTTIKSVKLPVVDHKANLPKDYQDYIRIGICHNGILINFDKNDDLCLESDSPSCPCSEEEIQNGIQNACDGAFGNDGLTTMWTFPMVGQPYSYSYTVGSYGVGPGFYHGGYKMDLAKGQIIFDRCVTCEEVVLEYVGDVLNDMGNALILDSHTQCLVNYVNWQRHLWSPDPMLQRSERTRWNTWYTSLLDINSKLQKMNKHEWVQLFRAYTYQSVKA